MVPRAQPFIPPGPPWINQFVLYRLMNTLCIFPRPSAPGSFLATRRGAAGEGRQGPRQERLGDPQHAINLHSGRWRLQMSAFADVRETPFFDHVFLVPRGRYARCLTKLRYHARAGALPLGALHPDCARTFLMLWSTWRWRASRYPAAPSPLRKSSCNPPAPRLRTHSLCFAPGRRRPLRRQSAELLFVLYVSLSNRFNMTCCLRSESVVPLPTARSEPSYSLRIYPSHPCFTSVAMTSGYGMVASSQSSVIS